MQVGAELSKAVNKWTSLSPLAAYKLDKDTTVKSKVDSDGMLFGSYKAKISPMSTLTLATQIDTVKLAENNHKFGLELKIEPGALGLLGPSPPLPAGYSEQKLCSTVGMADRRYTPENIARCREAQGEHKKYYYFS